MERIRSLFTSEKTFPDKEKIDEIIIENNSPFILQTTTKSHIPKIFVGRKKEMKTITEAIENSIDNKSCIAIYIIGAGGSGKSTLYAHVYNAIKHKNYEFLKLGDNNYKLDAAFIDAPEDLEYCNILHIYNQVIQDLGKTSFFDELAFYTLKRILEIIEVRHKKENPLKDIDSHDQYYELKDQKLYERSIELVKEFYKILTIQKEINFNWHFLSKLFEVLNPDFEISMEAIDELNGTNIGQDKFIKNKTDAANLFNIITDLIGWLYKDKKVGIVIGIDNIESLLGTDQEAKFVNFFNMLLDFRNKISRTLLVVIGTSSTWHQFTSYLQNSDYYNQFQGLFTSNNISLKYLELAQIKQIVRKHLERLLNKYKLTLPVDHSLYPYSSEAIEYLYFISGRNIRRLQKHLNALWDEFQEKKEVIYISNAFEIMKRFKDSMSLNDYEIKILYNRLWSSEIKTSGMRSSLVESGLEKAFTSLMSESHQIYSVENNPSITIKDDGISKTVRPDILVTLSSQFKISDLKRIEFQVKIYEEKSSIPKKHIKTSQNLLEQKKIDYVYFVTTTQFTRSLIEELQNKFPERIGGIDALSKKAQAYLSLLTFYEDIFEKQITPSRAKILLKESLGITIGDFFQRVRDLPKISKKLPTTVSIESFSKKKPKIEEKVTEIKKEEKIEPKIHIEEKEEKLEPKPKKSYPEVIEDILLFMYKRTGRYKHQTTYNYLKGKILNYRDEEVKRGFKWLKSREEYADEISSASIKINDEGIELLKNLGKI
jgi:hypothetical protein